jgi:hypothetical protein
MPMADSPIRHIVMWRVRGETPDERRAAGLKVKAAFESLRGLIKGMTHLEVGLDVSGVDYACDVVLVTEFRCAADLEGYATHPEHLRVRKELGDIRITRHQVDYPALVTTLEPA